MSNKYQGNKFVLKEISDKLDEKKERRLKVLLCSAAAAFSGMAGVVMGNNSNGVAAAGFALGGLVWLANAIYQKIQMLQIDKSIKELEDSQNDECGL